MTEPMNRKEIIDDKIREQLREGFPPEAYSAVDSKPYLTTLKAMYVIERLNTVFGIGRWTIHTEVIKEQDDQVLIRGKMDLLDYDVDIPAQYGSHRLKGKGVELADGYKSAITDCITKSASYLEIGIDVFKGKIKPPGNKQPYQNNTSKKDQEQKTDLPPIKQWLSKDEYEIALSSDGKTIRQVLNDFDGTKGKGMRKEYREALKAKFMELKKAYEAAQKNEAQTKN